MLFNSFEFFPFFILVTGVYFLLPKKIKCYWLLLASYYFYMCWNSKYALLMLFATLSSYLCARLMQKKKRVVLFLGISSNIFLLVWFKYFNFLVKNINTLIEKANVKPIDYIDVILPVGISFYTFQVIGYMIDVYRGQQPEKNVIRYALFVSFYPQLVAGPIERSGNILGTLKDIEDGKIKYDSERVTNGLILILYGLFLKMVIADRVVCFVDNVFSSFIEINGLYLLIAAAAFTLQIYCDFSGYSLVAIGAAQVYGVMLMENFAAPYFSRSITEFWRRWHISLSSWFRDYVYIPLGGNRCSTVRNSVNILLTFLLSGLWHGAAWHYVIWGGCHGIIQVIEKRTLEFRNNLAGKIIKTECFSYKLLQTCVTLLMIIVAWIFFRANSLREAFVYIYHMCSTMFDAPFDINVLSELGLNRLEGEILLVSTFVLCCVDRVRYKYGMRLDVYLDTQNRWYKWAVCIFLFCYTLIYGVYGPGNVESAFIYFQF